MKLFNKLINLWPVILIAVLGFTPVIWFFKRGNVLIDGVDINFPLDPLIWFQRRLSVWNSVSNGGVDFSSSTAGLFFHLIQVIPYSLGLNLTLVQMISFIFWFLLIVFSAFWLSKIIFPKRSILQLLFVVLYSFNIYMFNSWENIKVANLSLVASIPMVLSILILLHDKKISIKRAVFFSVLTGVVLSGGGINPSYFITFFMILILYFLADLLTHIRTDNLKSALINLGVVIFPIILINLFWILPTVSFIVGNLSPSGSIDKLGFTNWVDSLSDNTSLVNVIRLQGAWDWYAFDEITNQPLYIPYSINYFHRLPFLAFSFLLPTLAFLSFWFVKKENKHLYASFGVMLIIGLFLGTGTHLPTGNFFRWLMEHLPFFTLFRSPWYIFSPLVTLSYAGLICLFLYNFKLSKAQRFNAIAIPVISVGLIAGNLVYSYPVVTGKIFRPASKDGFYVNFPGYVFEAKRWLGANSDKKIAGYPDDEIENFNWGYRGIESILSLFASNETIFSPLSTPDSPIATLVKKFYRDLKKEEWDGAYNLAEAMGVTTLFEKRDQSSLSFPLPSKIVSLPSVNMGPWNFYDLPKSSENKKIHFVSSLLFAYPYSPYPEGVEAIGLLDTSKIILNPEDKVIEKIPLLTKSGGRIVLSRSSQEIDFTNFKYSPSILSNRLILRNMAQTIFDFTIPEEGIYQPVLERYRLEDFGIDLSKDLKIKLDDQDAIWKINGASDTYVYFQTSPFSRGSHKIALSLNNNNLISGGNFDDGIKFTKGGYGEGFAEYKIEEADGNKYLSIFNVNKADVSADFKISPFDPMSSYYVGLKYRQIYGNNANVLVGQNNLNTLVKAQTERLPNYPEWHDFSFYFEPVQTISEAKIILSAPFTSDPLGTKILYDDLKVNKVFNNNLLFVKESGFSPQPPTMEFQKRSPVLYEGTVAGLNGPQLIVFSENYSPMWQIQLFNTDGSKIDVKSPHFSANLYANAWFLDGLPQRFKFRIYYEPQDLFNRGLIIGALTLAGSILLNLGSLRRKNNV